MDFILAIAGVISGFIDSIAGGGGLINVPVIAMYLGPGPVTIGTNKLVGLLAALVALLLYARRDKSGLRKTLPFCLAVGAGSFFGSLCGVFLPKAIFWWLLFSVCPLILWVTLKKDLWVREAREHQPETTATSLRMLAIGGAIGFYDGVWGPGGGTFMLLGLLFLVGDISLMQALVGSKLANTLSAGIALGNYAWAGQVRWTAALPMAAGVIVGASLGTYFASKKLAIVVRPVLVVVVVLLLIRLFYTYGQN